MFVYRLCIKCKIFFVLGLPENFTYTRIFPEILDINPFLERDRPVYRHGSPKWVRQWQQVEINSLNGIWRRSEKGGAGSWRWMPPELYWHVNVRKVHTEEKGFYSVVDTQCADIDWVIAYDYTVCKGFSGFADDDKYSCHELLRKHELGEAMSPGEKMRFEQDKKYLLNSRNKFKTYRDPVDYLYDWDGEIQEPLGLACYHNERKNLILLGPRGFGKSIWLDSLATHKFYTFGKMYYDQDYLDKDRKGSKTLLGFPDRSKMKSLEEYIYKTMDLIDGLGSEEGKRGYFFLNKMGRMDSADGLQNAHYTKRGGRSIRKGSLAKLKSFLFNDPSDAVSGRVPLIAVDEVGLIDKLKEILKLTGATMEVKGFKMGIFVAMGTAGIVEKIQQTREVFNNPKSFYFLSKNNLYERFPKEIGLFLPDYVTHRGFKDENGNTKYDLALEDYMSRRKKALDLGENAFEAFVYASPVLPSELFNTTEDGLFPKRLVKHRLDGIEFEEIVKNESFLCDISYNGNSPYITRKSWGKHKYIKECNPSAKDYPGEVLMHEMPRQMSHRGKDINSFYKVVFDPVKDKKGIKGRSINSVLVVSGQFSDDLLDNGSFIYDNIVAEFHGRHENIDDTFALVVALSKLYHNAPILFESNITGFERYCSDNGVSNLLLTFPQDIDDFSKRWAPGFEVRGENKAFLLDQLKNWSLTSGTNGRGKPNVSNTNSEKLLNEMIDFGEDGNFDAISASLLWMACRIVAKSDSGYRIKPKEESRTERFIKAKLSQIRDGKHYESSGDYSKAYKSYKRYGEVL